MFLQRLERATFIQGEESLEDHDEKSGEKTSCQYREAVHVLRGADPQVDRRSCQLPRLRRRGRTEQASEFCLRRFPNAMSGVSGLEGRRAICSAAFFLARVQPREAAEMPEWRGKMEILVGALLLGLPSGITAIVALGLGLEAVDAALAGKVRAEVPVLAEPAGVGLVGEAA